MYFDEISGERPVPSDYEVSADCDSLLGGTTDTDATIMRNSLRPFFRELISKVWAIVYPRPSPSAYPRSNKQPG